MNSTHLKWEYAQRSSSYELPDNIECALENDYVKNAGTYTDETFKQIRLFFIISPNASASEILKFIKSSRETDKPQILQFGLPDIGH